MYVYFDVNGNLKEIINLPIREGSIEANKIYIYVEPMNNPQPMNNVFSLPERFTNAKINFRDDGGNNINPNGGNSVPMVKLTGDNAIQIPTDPKKDIYFFKYGFKYEMWSLELPSTVTSVNGLVSATAYLYNTSEQLALNTFSFNVEASVGVKPDRTMSEAQYSYLYNQLMMKFGPASRSVLVTELPETGEENVFYVLEENDKLNIYIWNGTTQSYIWVGDNTLDLGNYYTQEQGEQFESDINNRVSSIASGSPKGVYDTVEELSTAHPSGDNNIYLVGNYWYYWNSTSQEWTQGGQYLLTVGEENYVKKSSINLFDANSEDNIYGAFIQANSGIITSHTLSFVSHFIPVEEGQVIDWTGDTSYVTTALSCAFFGADKTTNIPVDASASITFSNGHFETTVPANAKFMRITGAINDLDTQKVIANKTWDNNTEQYGGDGTVFYNIKDGSIVGEKTDFVERINYNLFDKTDNDIIAKGYLDANGVVQEQGTNAYFSISGFIPVEEGKIYFVDKRAVYLWNLTGCYYDEDKVFVQNATSYPRDNSASAYFSINGVNCVAFVVPKGSGIKYIRTNIYRTNGITINEYMFIKGTFFDSYFPYTTYKYKLKEDVKVNEENVDIDLSYLQKSYIHKAKMISFGDSICYGAGWLGGYTKLIGDKYDMTYQNYGQSGATVTPNMRASSGGNYLACISTTLANTTPSFTPDFVLIEGGINDWQCSHGRFSQYNPDFVFGTYDMKDYDISHLDTTTFCGAFEYMLYSAITKWANARFIYILVHKFATIYNKNDADYGTEKDWYNYWVPKIKDMCDKWGVPVVDLNKNCPPLGFVTYYYNNYTNLSGNPDGLHPNENGYKYYYVPEIEKEMIRWLND